MQLQIETTSVCNARCHFCVYRTLNRKPGFMAMTLFQQILDDAANIPLIDHVCLTGLSESLLDPDLETRIGIVRRCKPDAFIDIYTNASYLTPLRFEALKHAGLDGMSISLNAADAETRKKVMGLNDWEHVINQITYAVKHRGKMKILIKAVVNEDNFTAEQSEVLYRLWGRVEDGGHFQTVREGNWTGENRTVRPFDPSEACIRALGQIYVTWDGKVTTCCFDPDGKQVFGDLNRQSLRDIYNSKEYVKFREAHFENRADEYEICKGCTRI